MNSDEWHWKCAERLHEQWPRVDIGDLEHLADALWRDERWRAKEPGEAALEWLAQGALGKVLAAPPSARH